MAGESTPEAERQARAEAAAKQRAQDAAVERQARAQAAAEARANRLIAAGRQAQAAWEGHGRPDRLIIATAVNRVGGVRVSWSTDIGLRNLTSEGDPTGVYTHMGSTGIALERVRVSGARRGLQIEKTTRGLTLDDSLIEHSSVAGVSIGGHEVRLDRLTVHDSATGVRVERGAGGVTARDLTVVGGGDGFVALTAPRGLVLRGLTVDRPARTAVRTFSPACRSSTGGSPAARPGSTPGPRPRSPGSPSTGRRRASGPARRTRSRCAGSASRRSRSGSRGTGQPGHARRLPGRRAGGRPRGGRAAAG